jgi:hypothetical protein
MRLSKHNGALVALLAASVASAVSILSEPLMSCPWTMRSARF